MPAKDHLSNQLKLFMTARELMDMPAGDDLEQWRPLSQNDDLFREKLGESMDTDLHQSIKETGVQEPVNLDFYSRDHAGTVISDGHHRIAAAYNVNPNMIIPIEYGDDKHLYNLGLDPRKKD